MKIIISRHGETEENRAGIIQGHLPGVLSELGKEQAGKLANRLKDEKIDLIVSSDLARASDTAKEVAKFHDGIKIVLDERLRELDFRDFQDKPRKNLNIDKDKASWDSLDKLNIEGSKDIFYRAGKFVEYIENVSEKNILLIGHSVICNAVIANLLNEKIEYFRNMMDLGNTSITVLEGENGIMKLKLLNNMEHLR